MKYAVSNKQSLQQALKLNILIRKSSQLAPGQHTRQDAVAYMITSVLSINHDPLQSGSGSGTIDRAVHAQHLQVQPHTSFTLLEPTS